MVEKKVYKIVWDKSTLDDFKDILSYLQEQSTEAPKIVKKAVLERIALIKKNPKIYELDKLKEPSDSDFRAFVVLNYRVSYQVKSERYEIRVLRVRHTSREPLGY